MKIWSEKSRVLEGKLPVSPVHSNHLDTTLTAFPSPIASGAAGSVLSRQNQSAICSLLLLICEVIRGLSLSCDSLINYINSSYGETFRIGQFTYDGLYCPVNRVHLPDSELRGPLLVVWRDPWCGAVEDRSLPGSAPGLLPTGPCGVLHLRLLTNALYILRTQSCSIVHVEESDLMHLKFWQVLI